MRKIEFYVNNQGIAKLFLFLQRNTNEYYKLEILGNPNAFTQKVAISSADQHLIELIVMEYKLW